MGKVKSKIRNIVLGAACALLAGTFIVSPLLPAFGNGKAEEEVSSEKTLISEAKSVDTHREKYFDPDVVSPLPEGLAEDREVSIVVKTREEGLLAAYDAQKSVTRYDGVAAFADSAEGVRVRNEIARLNSDARRKLSLSGAKYRLGASYDTLTGGFEIVAKAGEYAKIASALSEIGATAYISEEYAVCDTQIVENDVNVYGTGIFDSSGSPYDGTGTVVAVLDTGLDYTHTAFDPDHFTVADENLGMTLDDIAADLTGLRAYEYSAGITAESLYINRKVPYGYDYADKDTEVYPFNSEHGTHVAGVILGKDDVITGVAPNAQLAVMKVFSDAQESARWSWVLAALEDCVVLDVDVINMSLGTSSGFSVESKTNEAIIYQNLVDHGISLVAAASNDYNSTYGSEKNGNLGLTSNPDSATVGSPGSYTASLAVASISGVKTPYLKYGKENIYFNEASDTSAEFKNFVDDLFKNYPEGTEELQLDFQLIPGIGRTADYTDIDVKGKIALVRRGSNTFEDKARIAQQQGAAGVIIYNNVSGDIMMNVGFVSIAVCSISKDDGEMLAAAGKGKITISRAQVAGPFMSDFSSWGPTPDLRIKPEITAHGGEILSAVPGQAYERLSGTSMASPNQAGVTALVRQYVKDAFGLSDNSLETRVRVLGIVNRLMMSTADIARNTNGLPYSVRKQGAGLANLTEATTTPAYISTYDRETGEEMDKAKIELGDDPAKTGVYDLKFTVNNVFGTGDLSYDVGAIVMTEGVSETKTYKGDTTVTEKGYILEGADVSVQSVDGGTQNGNVVTVGAGKSATVVLRIVLSDSDKQYLDTSFANGMYVEGYVTLAPKSGTKIELNVPYLAFYGDWTQAPLFDIDYFETNKDELDDSIELLDKTLPDAFATRPIGGITGDYISYLGAYYFIQDPASTKISADRKYISLSNQEESVNYIYAVWAGMLRGAKRTYVTITDAATGEVIFTKEEYNVRKSYNGGGSISFGDISVDFHTADYDLKNNTKYNVRVEAYLDYGDGGVNTNKKNVFEFPFVTDFQSPIVTGCEYYTEYDRTAQKNRLYARVSVYDNHYAMGYISGYMVENEDYPVLSEYQYDAVLFNALPQQIYSEFNTETEITIELTDYLSQFRNAANKNSFIVGVYDYAMNEGLYELTIPDAVRALYFEEDKITISPNETYILDPQIYPSTEWKETIEYTVEDESIIRVVNGKILALKSGETILTARSADPGEDVVIEAKVPVKVLAPGEEGYVEYDRPVLNSFRLTGYTTDKAFYILSNEDRDIGMTGGQSTFSPSTASYALTMYPSEQVTIQYLIDAYYPEETRVVFTSNNDNIVRVSESGQITAVAEGFSSISVRVLVGGQSTLYDYTISITVKNPFEQNGQYLLSYRGNGGKVEIPGDLGFKQIYQFAFSGYEYIPKDENDEISEEDPTYSKPWYIGENSITEVVIPEGVEVIGNYAFAGLTALQKVTLPSTLTKISQGAFYGCTSLKTIEGLGYVKFINKDAFSTPVGRVPVEKADLSSIIAVGDYAFANTNLLDLTLPDTAQSIGAGAFRNSRLSRVTIRAGRVKLGAEAFGNCTYLRSINLINAYVIPDGVFAGCTDLSSVTLGADVATIGNSAFGGTKISAFTVVSANPVFKAEGNGAYLVDKEGKELKLVAPVCGQTVDLPGVERIGAYAFSGNETVMTVRMPDVTSIGEYAFAGTDNLRNVTFGALTSLGAHCFEGSGIRSIAGLGSLTSIPDYAFRGSAIQSVDLGEGTVVGIGAFEDCASLTSVTAADGVKLGERAFYSTPYVYNQLTQISFADGEVVNGFAQYYYSDSVLRQVRLGENVEIGDRAFANANLLSSVTIGSGTIGEEAFYNNGAASSGMIAIDLSGVTSIGARAFSGELVMLYEGEIGDEDSAYLLGPSSHTQAATITEVDLGGLAEGENGPVLGEDAFAYCNTLVTVRNFTGVKTVPAGAFRDCESLSSIDLSNAEWIGDFAFEYSALKRADLSKATYIGVQAFEGMAASEYSDAVSLEQVTLRPEGVVVGDAAFVANTELAVINGIENVTSYGAYAFANCKIEGKLDLTKAVRIGDFAFGGTGISEVVLSEGLQSVGQNPFADCPIPLFGKKTEVLFQGNPVETVTEYTYDINAGLKVIDGALYRVVPYGLELICYPKNVQGKEIHYSVAENTVRIGAQAFYDAPVAQVDLPVTLRSIGDKAFYGCEKLQMVIFRSYQAPILEEQYDESYLLVSNFPGSVAGYVDSGSLGVTDYMMWSPYFTTFFFGANFDDYIGRAKGDITMVRPENGLNYTSFIFRQYFDNVIDGPTAPEEGTLAAIAAIDRIPATVTLDDEAVVAEARRLYDLISTDGQRALVTNYSKLVSAENTIAFLKGDVTPPAPEEEKKNNLPLILGIVFGVLGVAIIAGAVTWTVLYFEKKKKGEPSGDDGDGAPGTADTDADKAEPSAAAAEEDASASEPSGKND